MNKNRRGSAAEHFEYKRLTTGTYMGPALVRNVFTFIYDRLF